MHGTAFGGAGWRAVHLDPALDRARVAALLAAAPDLSVLTTGEPPAPGDAAAFFEDRPPARPGATVWKLGIEAAADDGRETAAARPLLGLLDVALDYPASGTWYVALLLVRPDRRGRGLGTAVVETLAGAAAAADARALRLVVIEANRRGRAFWARLGFRVARVVPPERIGRRVHARLELERPLDAAADRAYSAAART